MASPISSAPFSTGHLLASFGYSLRKSSVEGEQSYNITCASLIGYCDPDTVLQYALMCSRPS